MASSVTTYRSSFCTESIGEHRGAVTGIGADIAKAMSTVSDPRPASEHPYPYLLLVRSEPVFGGCLHSGLPLVGDGSCWSKMAEAASLAVGTDALAGGTVSGDVGDVERPSTDPRALSSRQALQNVPGCHKVAAAGPGKRPS